MTEISNNQDSSTVHLYPSGMDMLQFYIWRTALCSLDKRVEFSDDIIPFLNRNLSPAERNKLFNYLKLFLLSAHNIEKGLRVKWGIPQVANKIEILNSEKFRAYLPPGPRHINNAYAKNGLIQIQIDDPKQYDRFFAISKYTYAHELGHALFEYDHKGDLPWGNCRSDLPWDGCLSTEEYFDRLKYDLSQDGKLERKYFKDVPFCILPKELLFPEKASTPRPRLMNCISELMADKVSLQLCGYKEAKEGIRSKIEGRVDTKDSWERLFYIVLAREFKLNQEEKILLQGLAKLDCPWRKSISTEELLNKMCAFFEQVSLKHQ